MGLLDAIPFKDTIAYHAQVNVLGRTYLRYQRYRSELRARAPGRWTHEHLSPPLLSTPRLKELISLHYLEGRHANGAKKVAWVTSGGPVEYLKALGFHTVYPENHGAVCGVRRKAEELSQVAEEDGYGRDICSYARTDIGSVLSGKTPVGRLPKPDVLVCCTNICQTVLYWYQVLAHHFGVPLVVIDTPFIYDEAHEHAVRYVQRQLEASVPVLERVAETTLTERAFSEAVRHARDAAFLWLEIMETGQSRPAPISAFDEFFFMAPIVDMRGEAVTVDFYAGLLDELRGRVAKGIGSIRRERKRLLWDNLPIWFKVRYLSETLSARGVSVVASTYTNAWGELAPMIRPEAPFESAAEVYLHPILNRGTGHKLATMRRMVRDYHVDGVILHSDRSCKPYSIGQVDQREQLVDDVGVPTLLLEADHNDPRAFSDEQAQTRIEAFLELIEGA